MDAVVKVQENALYDIWRKQSYHSPLKTINGDDIYILDIGIHDGECAGPDFKNVRIRIGNLTYIGDIEIDCDYSDWKSHGHHIDNKYSKVILHVSLYNKNKHAYVYTRDGRKVPSVCFSEFIDEKIVQEIHKTSLSRKTDSVAYLKCHSLISIMQVEKKENFIYQLGVQRLEKKCKKIFNRLKELQLLKELNVKEPIITYELSAQFHLRKFNHSDFKSKEIWQQLFYELIFEALGFSKNKTQMIELAKLANVKFLSKIESDGVLIEKYEAALFYISGLIQSAEAAKEPLTKTYAGRLQLHWNSINSFYDGKIMDETDWHFFRLRPQNFPTIRIAGGAKILNELTNKNLIHSLVKKISEIHNLTVLINSLRSLFVIKAEGFWKNHYVFDQTSNAEVRYFVGASRADEIVVNVVLPFFGVYFEVFGNTNLSKKIIKLYSIYQQKSENQIINEVAHSLNYTDGAKRTIISQGMIELFRNFCSKNKCLECEIGKTVFS